MLPLKDTVGEIIAIGINFSCKLPMSVSKQFFNKQNPFTQHVAKNQIILEPPSFLHKKDMIRISPVFRTKHKM